MMPMFWSPHNSGTQTGLEESGAHILVKIQVPQIHVVMCGHTWMSVERIALLRNGAKSAPPTHCFQFATTPTTQFTTCIKRI